jgi:UDPglucose 6-dehydrogenase
MVRATVAAGRLRFTTDIEAAVAHGVLQFIAVGTPPDEDGSADLQYVVAAARNIGRHMTGYKVVWTNRRCRSVRPTRCVPASPRN